MAKRPKYRGYRRKLSSRAVILMIAVAAIVGVTAFLLIQASIGVLSAGSRTFEISGVKAVVVRDEQVVNTANYGSITPVADEGALVEMGDEVAQVYQWGYNANTVSELITLQQEINAYQLTLLQDVVNVELNERNAAIEAKLDEIALALRNKKTNLLELERQLEALLELRRKLLDSSVQADLTLTGLYEEESAFLSLLEDWRETLSSPNKGRVSFYFDNFETPLNSRTLYKISRGDINAIKNGTAAVAIDSDNRAVYRLVNDEVWYLVLTTEKNNDYPMVQGENYTVVLDGYYDQEYEGLVLSADRTDSGSMYVMEIRSSVEPVLTTRTVTCSIRQAFTGLEVDSAYINSQNGIYGVYIRNGDATRFVQVDVLYNDGKRALVRSQDVGLYDGVQCVR